MEKKVVFWTITILVLTLLFFHAHREGVRRELCDYFIENHTSYSLTDNEWHMDENVPYEQSCGKYAKYSEFIVRVILLMIVVTLWDLRKRTT